MSKEKTAEFLVDCLAHMPQQPEQLQLIIYTVIAGLTRIANGQEWPRDEARAARTASSTAARASRWAAHWAAYLAAHWAADAPHWAADAAARSARAADWAADWATHAHPDPDAERARQAKVRKELGV